jgi:hypothetical protein
VRSMFPAKAAVFASLEAIRIILLILHRRIIPVLADRTR